MSERPKKEARLFLIELIGHDGDDCVLWPFAVYPTGYGQLANKGGGSGRAHRVMCELAHGKPPSPAHDAAHSCGNRACVNPKHLSWKTRGANHLDKREHGTANAHWRHRGGRRYVLTAEQAAEIRSLAGRETVAVTAERFGISESNVYHIRAGRSWRPSTYPTTEQR